MVETTVQEKEIKKHEGLRESNEAVCDRVAKAEVLLQKGKQNCRTKANMLMKLKLH